MTQEAPSEPTGRARSDQHPRRRPGAAWHGTGPSSRHAAVVEVGSLALATLAVAVLDVPLPFWEARWALALQVLPASSSAALMSVVVGRWAILPTWALVSALRAAAHFDDTRRREPRLVLLAWASSTTTALVLVCRSRRTSPAP